jgi:hypothetical protein
MFKLLVSAIGAIGATVTIWLFCQRPVPKIEILHEKPVFSIHEEIPGLDILFNKEDIRASRKSISLILLKFSNDGNENITRSHFDDEEPVYISIQNGELINSSPDNFISELSDTTHPPPVVVENSNNRITFKKFSLNKKQYIIFKFILLHEENSSPKISLGGMIDNNQLKNLKLYPSKSK